MINWRVRFNNKVFWIAFIPAVITLIQTIAAVFGITVDLSVLGDKLVLVVEAVFSILILLGVTTDPTTKGLGDSSQALSYDKPKEE